MVTIPARQVISIPEDVAVCPYCSTPLYASATAWTQDDDGQWVGSSLDIDCESEPEEMESEEWEEWVKQHTYMPYVYMLPVHKKVEEWIETRFRFDLS